VHEPQSDSAMITALASAAISCRIGSGAVRVLVGFFHRFSRSPRAASSTSSRSTNSSPRILPISSSATVPAASSAGAATGARRSPAASAVGSRNRLSSVLIPRSPA